MARSLLSNVIHGMLYSIIDIRVASDNTGATINVGPGEMCKRAGFGVQTHWTSSMDWPEGYKKFSIRRAVFAYWGRPAPEKAKTSDIRPPTPHDIN